MRNGEIHNVDFVIEQLEEGIKELKKLKKEDFFFFVPYPVLVSKADDLGLPMYTTTYMGSKLYSVIHTTYQSPWSKRKVLLQLKMNAPIRVIKNPGYVPLNILDKKIVRFIASDGYYVFVKFEDAKNWFKIGEYINFKEIKGGLKNYVDDSWK